MRVYPRNSAHAIETCAWCGGEMVYNVPRLGPEGGYVHKESGHKMCPPETPPKTPITMTSTPAGDPQPCGSGGPTYFYTSSPKYPCKCPICEGHGNVPGGFYSVTPGVESYSSSVAMEKCRACDGGGIIWSQ